MNSVESHFSRSNFQHQFSFSVFIEALLTLKSDYERKGNLAYDKAFSFAKSMVNLYKQLTETLFSKYYSNADEIRKVLFATLKTTKLKN